MDIRLVKQPAVFGNVQVGIENFFFQILIILMFICILRHKSFINITRI